jgi:DNA-binding transcriptional ArsR family regulator
MQSTALQTLADPTRLLIVEALLARGEQPVGDLVAAASIHQSGVSRHLRILQESGFVRMRPEGAQRLYSLRPEPFRELDDWLSRYRRLWESRLDRLAVALARRKRASALKRKETT